MSDLYPFPQFATFDAEGKYLEGDYINTFVFVPKAKSPKDKKKPLLYLEDGGLPTTYYHVKCIMDNKPSGFIASDRTLCSDSMKDHKDLGRLIFYQK